MSKFPKQSCYCLFCDWEIIDTHNNLDGIRCLKCNEPVTMGKRKAKQKKRSISLT